MKNIYLLETNSPSNLGIQRDLKLHLKDSLITKNLPHFLPQYIYITSHEEIKEDVSQWYLDDFLNKPYNSGGAQYSSKQNIIILTNDPELIADGVQPISNEFLLWFVKNPKCEKVEVAFELKAFDKSGFCVSVATLDDDYTKNIYYPIIPKEELEQETTYIEEEVLKLLISFKDRFTGSDLDNFVSDAEVELWLNRNKKN